MKKIMSVFQRNHDSNRLLRDEVMPGAEWVIEGEGMATAKWDGTAVLIRHGGVYRRYDAKGGKQPPSFFLPAQQYDPITGHWPGWVPVGTEADSHWHRIATKNYKWSDGTYELIGPKINGNPHGVESHVLMPHGEVALPMFPRTYAAIAAALAELRYEGVVWHHADGRMAKVKRKDFGLRWPVRS